jgi:hypothetical protein
MDFFSRKPAPLPRKRLSLRDRQNMNFHESNLEKASEPVKGAGKSFRRNRKSRRTRTRS